MGKLDSSQNEQGAKRPSARRLTGEADSQEEPENAGGDRDDDELTAEDSANVTEADAEHDEPELNVTERADADPAHEVSVRDSGPGGKRVRARRPARAGASSKNQPRQAATQKASSHAADAPAPESNVRAAAAPRVRGARASSVPPTQQLIPYASAAASSQSEHVVWQSEAASPALARARQYGSHDRLSKYSEAANALVPASELSDDFGLDPDYEAKIRPWLERLTTQYARIEVEGAQRVPAQGRVLLVVNHSRAPLWDGILLRNALRLHHETSRVPRWLVDDQQYHAPFLGTFVNRLGAVRACQENAERLLSREELVAVFPEGANAAQRRYEDRHRLQRFGRGGIVKLALRTRTPVIPVGIVMCDHPEAVWRNRVSRASRLLGAPLLSVGPSWARVGLLGLPPIASHIRIRIGEPIRALERHDFEATRDDALVHELNECVRDAVQELVDGALRA